MCAFISPLQMRATYFLSGFQMQKVQATRCSSLTARAFQLPYHAIAVRMSCIPDVRFLHGAPSWIHQRKSVENFFLETEFSCRLLIARWWMWNNSKSEFWELFYFLSRGFSASIACAQSANSMSGLATIFIYTKLILYSKVPRSRVYWKFSIIYGILERCFYFWLSACEKRLTLLWSGVY